jgi:hypothetical protein
MSLSLISQPLDLSLSKNDIFFILQTNNYVINAGSYASKMLRVFPASGNSFNISWGSTTLSFTATNGSLGNTGLLVSEYTGSTSTDQNNYIINLATELKSNPYLFESFDITYLNVLGTNYVYFQARNLGPSYELTINSSTTTVTVISSTVATNKSVRDNFNINLEVWVNDPGTTLDGFKRLITLSAPPNSNNQAEFNISTVLDRFMESLNPLDAPNAFNTGQNTKLARKYYVRYYESYGDPEQKYAVTQSATKTVLLGGLKKEDWPGNTMVASLLTSNSSSLNKPFLTWLPATKIVTRAQYDVLYYYYCQTVNTSSLNSKMKLYFNNGTNSTFTVDTFSNPSAGVYCFGCGFANLGLSGFETSTVKVTKYEIWLTDSTNTRISAIRTFYVDDISYEFEKIFYYRNSLGGYDVIRFTGDTEKSKMIEYDESGKFLPSNYSAATGESVKNDLNYNDVYEAGSGLLDKDVKIALEDLLISKDVYVVIGTKLLSIFIMNKDEKIYNEGDDLHPLVLKYRRNYTNRAFSIL